MLPLSKSSITNANHEFMTFHSDWMIRKTSHTIASTKYFNSNVPSALLFLQFLTQVFVMAIHQQIFCYAKNNEENMDDKHVFSKTTYNTFGVVTESKMHAV